MKKFQGINRYLFWWIIFALVGGFLSTPVGLQTGQSFLMEKLLQLPRFLPFGIIAGIMFTFSQNSFNKERSKGRFWAIAISTWMLAKFIVFSFSLILS